MEKLEWMCKVDRWDCILEQEVKVIQKSQGIRGARPGQSQDVEVRSHCSVGICDVHHMNELVLWALVVI